MSAHHGAGGRSRGYVRAVFSERAGAALVPAGLVRDLLRVLRRSKALDARRLRLAAERGRLRAGFADYLVTDEEPAFSERRARHSVSDAFARRTGRPYVIPFDAAMRPGFAFADLLEHPIDAPEFVAAGAMHREEFGACASFAAPCLYMRAGVL